MATKLWQNGSLWPWEYSGERGPPWNPYIMVSEGGVIPRLYGIAYVDFLTNRAYTYPVPLNWLIGFCNRVWWRVKHGPARSQAALAWREGWEACERRYRSEERFREQTLRDKALRDEATELLALLKDRLSKEFPA